MPQIKSSTAYLGLVSDKKLFMLMLVVIVVITVDSNIAIIADFIHEQISSGIGIAGFIAIWQYYW